jgi:hypothetical protein
MQNTMPKVLSEIEVARIKQKFRALTGRDLTAEELKYLGLSATLYPLQADDTEAKRKAVGE